MKRLKMRDAIALAALALWAVVYGSSPTRPQKAVIIKARQDEARLFTAPECIIVAPPPNPDLQGWIGQ